MIISDQNSATFATTNSDICIWADRFEKLVRILHSIDGTDNLGPVGDGALCIVLVQEFLERFLRCVISHGIGETIEVHFLSFPDDTASHSGLHQGIGEEECTHWELQDIQSSQLFVDGFLDQVGDTETEHDCV